MVQRKSKRFATSPLLVPAVDELQAWCGEVSVWMRLKHPNVVPCLGATANPLQVVMDLMSNGEVMDYTKRNSNANRAHLVSSLVFSGKGLTAQRGAMILGVGLC